MKAKIIIFCLCCLSFFTGCIETGMSDSEIRSMSDSMLDAKYFLSENKEEKARIQDEQIRRRIVHANEVKQRVSTAVSLQDFEVIPKNDQYIIASDRRKWYVDRHPDLSSRTREAILKGIVHLQMTSEQVRASIGLPDDINRTVYSFGVHEQWVYGKYGDRYLYFEDGILTSWQD